MDFVSPFDFKYDVIVWAVRAFYIFAIYAIIIVRFIPDLKVRFLDYGARTSASPLAQRNLKHESALPRWMRIQFDPALDWHAEQTVPHDWFTHFYLICFSCSAYWIFHHGKVLEAMITKPDAMQSAASWEGRTFIAMVLLQLQALRRLYECLVIAKPSKSRMWIGHYAIGVAFYLVTNIAVWIEPRAIPNRYTITSSFAFINCARTVVCIVFFLYCSQQQYLVHKYLASLKEYKVPDHPIFARTNLVAPHYTFETYIYLALTILTASDGRILNITMLCATAFVAINLGVTADLTRQWQLKRFPKQRNEILGHNRMFSFW